MSSAAAQPGASIREPQQILDYLKSLGYAADPEPDEEVPPIEQQLSAALRGFQKFYQLPVTGELDEETSAELRAPRCGMADPQPGLESTELGGIWTKKSITYFSDPVPANLGIPKAVDPAGGLLDLPRLDKGLFDAIVDQCFATWAPVTGLTFTRTTDRTKANIILGFSDAPGLGFGPGGTAAGLGASPPSDGNRSTIKGTDATILFDATDGWFPATVLPHETALVKVQGQVFETVALHEIGHALGIGHSRRQDAVMFPTSRRVTSLSQDDVLAARARYLQPGTELEETDDRFDFACGPNDDLFVIKRRGTDSHHTEVHVLSAESNYRHFTLHRETAFQEVSDDVKFDVAPNGDVFIFVPNPVSKKTEIHILAADTKHATFALHKETALENGDEFLFAVAADNRDVFVFKPNRESHRTEIHILSAATEYTTFSGHVPTNVEDFNGEFFFGVLPNRDVIAVKVRNTDPKKQTEAHVLTAASGYRGFRIQQGIGFSQLDGKFVVAPKRDGDVLIIQKNGTASHQTEVHSIRVALRMDVG